MRFKFSLETVKRVFAQQLKQTEYEVAGLLKQKRALELGKEKITESKQKLNQRLEAGITISGAQIQAYSQMLDVNTRKMRVFEEEIEIVDLKKDEKVKVLKIINQKKSALEKLEERQRREFKVTASRKEQKSIDEAFSKMSQRKR